MATKRRLYKPAQVKKVVPKENRRKPLAQGRLIINQSLDSSKDDSVASQELIQNSTSLSEDANQSKSLTQTARRNLSSLLKSDALLVSETDPRRITPYASVHKSPEVSHPSESLELSDTGSDVVHSPRDVLVVDASQRTETSQTEVDVHLEYMNSPAKVIRHSPPRTHLELSQLSGDVSQACQVTVDTIPRVNITDDPEFISRSKHDDNNDVANKEPQPSGHKQPEEVVEKDVQEHPLNDIINRDPVTLLFQEETEDSEQHDPLESSQSTIHLELPASLTQSANKCSTTTSTTQTKKGTRSKGTNGVKEKQKAQPKIKSAALLTSSFTTKKKASRTVPSRYMQSINKGPMKATDRSTMMKTPSTATKKTTANTSKSSITCKKKKTTPVSSFTGTPDVKYVGAKVSTPATDDSMFLASDGINVSEIKYDTAAPRCRLVTSMMSANSSYKQGEYSNCSSHTDSREKQKDPDHVSQKLLDIMYARYIQWVYIESKAKKAFQDQEQQVMEQLYALSLENQKLMEANEELDRQIIQARHLRTLDSMLETQETGLTPITPHLAQVKTQYNELAAALDTTRHFMPMKDMVIPEDDEEAVNLLVPALLESEELLGEISLLAKPEQTKISLFAAAVQELKKTVISELEQVDRCTELTAATGILLTQESALYVNNIQDVNMAQSTV